MASKKELWCEDEFPAPIGDSVQTRYLISQDDDDSYALYLNVMHTGKKWRAGAVSLLQDFLQIIR